MKKYFSGFDLTVPFFEKPKFSIYFFLSKGISFFKEVVISYYFGSSIYKDAYVLIISFYETFTSIIKNIIETTFSPLYFNSKRKKTFIGNYFILITFLVMFLFVLLFNFSNNFFQYLYPNNNLYNQIIFTIVLFSSVLNIYFVLYKVICNVKENFHEPEKRNIYFSMLFIITLIFFKSNALSWLEFNDLYTLTFSIFITNLGILLFLLFKVLKTFAKGNLILYSKKDRFSNLIRHIFKFSTIIVIIHSGQELFQNYLAANMSVGTLSWNDYAKKIYFHSIAFTYLLMGPIVIQFMQKFSQKERFDLLLNIKKYFTFYLLLSAFGFFFSPEIVRILFFRGAFNYNDWINVTSILKVFFISLPFGIYNNFAYFIFATISFKLSIIFNLIIFITFIFTCLLLNKTFTYNTFALATLISNLFGFFFYFYYILGPYNKIFNRNL